MHAQVNPLARDSPAPAEERAAATMICPNEHEFSTALKITGLE
jgi:hypothetical protein